jgi:threonine synthase
MRYISTRGAMPATSFTDCVLMGLAPDGGLVIPDAYPVIDASTLAAWRDLSYVDLAFEIIQRFATDIPSDDLRGIISRAYTAEQFGSDDITPVFQLRNGLHVLALSNGPTLAFKDIAMQFLGQLLDYILITKGQRLTIIGATSGDTGSAAAYALRGKAAIDVYMMSPAGKMSPFQRAQMYSLMDDNIHNLAVDGFFDDCQAIVKTLQQDTVLNQALSISTVNSINIARIVAQVVYYFKAYFAVSKDNDEKVSFCVPSGNFGNVCAGHIAKQMGLPIGRLMVATNENNVLNEYFTSGLYRPRMADETMVTSSPSMDISKASNIERFIFDLLGRDAAAVRAAWSQVEQGKTVDLRAKLTEAQERFGFVSGESKHATRLATIKSIYASDGRLIDPHTADGIYVAQQVRLLGETVICLETALSEKFADTMKEALGFEPPLDPQWAALFTRPQRVTPVQDAASVRALILARASRTI